MFHIEGSMKWTVMVLVVLAIFCNRLKTAAQNGSNDSLPNSSLMPTEVLPTTTMEINETLGDMLSPSSIVEFSTTMIVIDNTSMTMVVTPTMETTSFTITITTMPMPTSSVTPPTSVGEPSTSTTSSVVTTSTSSVPSQTAESQSEDEGLGTGVIIGIAAGGAAAVVVIIIILCVCFCCCYQKHHREESYSMGPTVTARYWDANHPNDAGPGHVTSGGSMRSRTSWRDSLRSFTRGSLRRSLSLRRSSKRAKDKQQPSEYIGLYSTPL